MSGILFFLVFSSTALVVDLKASQKRGMLKRFSIYRALPYIYSVGLGLHGFDCKMCGKYKHTIASSTETGRYKMNI